MNPKFKIRQGLAVMTHRLSATSAILVAAACFSSAAVVVSAVPSAFTSNFDVGSTPTSGATVTIDCAEPMQDFGFNTGSLDVLDRIQFMAGSMVAFDRPGISFGGAMQYFNFFGPGIVFTSAFRPSH
jgi:hypothetical protein